MLYGGPWWFNHKKSGFLLLHQWKWRKVLPEKGTKGAAQRVHWSQQERDETKAPRLTGKCTASEVRVERCLTSAVCFCHPFSQTFSLGNALRPQYETFSKQLACLDTSTGETWFCPHSKNHSKSDRVNSGLGTWEYRVIANRIRPLWTHIPGTEPLLKNRCGWVVQKFWLCDKPTKMAGKTDSGWVFIFRRKIHSRQSPFLQKSKQISTRSFPCSWKLQTVLMANQTSKLHRNQARIQDFGQGGPAEFWPQGGPWAQILFKIRVFP